MRPRRHRKLTEEQLNRLKAEAALHLKVTPYKILAAELGFTHGGMKSLMARLIAEARSGAPVVRRGTNHGAVDECVKELRAAGV